MSRPAPAGEGPWLVNGGFNGDLNKVRIHATVLEPFGAEFRGDALALTGDWHWQGDLNVRDLDLRAWGAGNALGQISGPLQISGNHLGFAAVGTLNPAGLGAGPMAVDFSGNYAARTLTIAHVNIGHRPSGAQLKAAGQIAVTDAGPRLDLHGQWHAFRWPLTDNAPAVRSGDGDFTLGGLKPYAFTAAGDLQVLAEPALRVRAAGRLAHDGLELPEATLEALGGHAQLHGTLKWTPALSWSAAGVMHGLDVSSLRPSVNGRLNFGFDASGQGFGRGRTLRAAFSDISGQVRGRSAGGHAAVTLDGDEWLLQQVHLQLGDTHLEADGRIGAQLDLHFAVDIADMALLQPGAHGQLRATGRLRGDTTNPFVLARMSGSELGYGRLNLNALEAHIDFDPHGSGHANINVQLDKLRVANREIGHASFVTSGTAESHRFNVQRQRCATDRAGRRDRKLRQRRVARTAQ